ncbi:MAG: hypothetical protein A3I77_02405 [Gammaproteobacteria bacterium RIFCSPLOWO2_02_FULL_42_14]|nr:MAG: hypothetical protein A3B71_02245 [Gammaproteobacteria bacterium RIFCSPHIGHO2_02_FULL_42_43]OGT29009.1 MAG: hypothetical protein A2624_00195 [Gammaproteobacteria bacterium RIFCSPHIGHO2_01_FULL_42_8]OGT53505.1 MAG: hypothetical protein A3E54_02270 [Gammaproteobacteria bacterium RIFCSPHIGHO2_12_FULL_41_25]OGT61451.1 MAG: hypothetical protein A3I77_02405 [Gammaproteobacteria bacterium RIFCSPLOWO2_02_FULL_42_14]OGT86485.1 MAG: hypothetical protein A3G86_02510 [Gammaproteobacteria bacterium R
MHASERCSELMGLAICAVAGAITGFFFVYYEIISLFDKKISAKQEERALLTSVAVGASAFSIFYLVAIKKARQALFCCVDFTETPTLQSQNNTTRLDAENPTIQTLSDDEDDVSERSALLVSAN